MAQKSFYDVLLVDQDATFDEIKLAFKRRALQVHPDKGGSKEEFHLVYQALETLADPTARKKYDHGLATRAGISTGPKRKRRADQNAHPATSSKAETEKKAQTFASKRSTTSAGKAPSKSTRPTATPAEPQSKQTKLLMKIRDLLKQLPRDARNDVITNQFSQKQRVILERFMADTADTSSGTQVHSEAKAVGRAAGESAPNQPGFETSSTKTPQGTMDSSHDLQGSCSIALCGKFPCAKPREKTKKCKRMVKKANFDAICNEPYQATTPLTVETSDEPLAGQVETHTIGEMAKQLPKVKAQNKKKVFKTKAQSNQSSGCLQRSGWDSGFYVATICFDSFGMRTGNCDFKTALENLLILTAVKQKMRNHAGASAFVERLHASLISAAAEHGRNLADLKLRFLVHQPVGCFIGGDLRSPAVRSIEVFGKMRSLLEPFRQYAKNMGWQSVYWCYDPVHLQDAWERFQIAVADTWEIAGVDSTAILQKIRSLYEAHAPFRSTGLQRWERQHMAMHDKNRHRPWRLRQKMNPSLRLERWERRQMAMEDKNKHGRVRKFTSESRLSRKLLAVRKLIARWARMLKKEAKLVDKERQKVIRQRKAQQKKDQEERRRVEVLKQKRQREEERSRREWVRKRMRSDLTMDDILGPKDVRIGKVLRHSGLGYSRQQQAGKKNTKAVNAGDP